MDPKYHLEEQHQQLCTHDLFAQILYSHNFYIRLLHMFMYGNIQQSKTMKVNKNLVYTDTHTHLQWKREARDIIAFEVPNA